MTERKFHRTLIEIEVLSEDPYEPRTLSEITYDVIEGDCSGNWSVKSSSTLTGKEAAQALTSHGSDPSFFMLDDEGNDL